MSETKTNDEVVSQNPIEKGDVNTESKSDYKVDLKTGTTKKQETSTITKVDLTKKPETDAIQIGETGKMDVGKQTGDSAKVDKQIPESSQATEEFKQIQEVTEEELKKVENVVKEAVRDEKVLGKQLPENIEKLVSFMEETGGTVEDYVRLSADYSNVDGETLLKEYYKKSKPHLNDEEIGFIMEDNFSYDEELDDEREVRKKKLALKEEVAKAHGYLEELKGKYYDEIKLRPGVTQEQQNATDFFNRYNENQQVATQQHEDFKTKTKELLSNDFKGFEFKVGDKNFRYGVKNPSEVAESQSNITTFVQKFLDNDGAVKDHEGYHKAMYAARNADTIAQHFYEQGKADAVKDVIAKSKNISNDSRPQPTGDVFVGGFKVKAVSGADSSSLKIKTRKFNN
tara:strand:- start:404 stop:1600 length:1197 start_codon:yes stop_codon:yes gene_type:complete